MVDLHVRLEQHWLACMATAGGGGRVTRFKGALVVSNPRVAGMFLNFILPWDVEPRALPQVLELGGALLAGDGRPPAVFLTPAAGDQRALAAGLLELGWRRSGLQVALVCDLTDAVPASVPNVQVEEIGPARLNLWASTLVRAYEVSPVTGKEIRAGWTSLMQAPGEGCVARFYLGRKGGAPAGTGLYWGQGEVAGFYCGAVLPEFRRQGVERATLTRRMADAAADGRRLGMLQTEPGSPVEHLCTQHLGFRLAHEREIWVPPAPGNRR